MFYIGKRDSRRLIILLYTLLLALGITFLSACDTISVVTVPSATVSAPTPVPIGTATLIAGWNTLLQRPLRLPSLSADGACPRDVAVKSLREGIYLAVGVGPVYAGAFLPGNHGILPYVPARLFKDGTSAWGGQKMLWLIDPSFSGPVIVRGHQVDGPHDLLFDGGYDRVSELLPALRLYGQIGSKSEWVNWTTETRIQADGCYAYQIDGPSFSYTIVFQAVEQS